MRSCFASVMPGASWRRSIPASSRGRRRRRHRDADDGRRHRRRAMLSTLLALGFDASKFRFCAESSFCEETRPAPLRRNSAFCRARRADGVRARAWAWQPELGANTTVRLRLDALAGSVAVGDAPLWRLRLVGAAGGGNAFRAGPVVLRPPRRVRLAAHRAFDGGVQLLRAEGARHWSEVELTASPLQLRLYVGAAGRTRSATEPPVAVFNGGGLLRFAAHEKCAARVHRWSGFVDSRPHGCTAVAADVGFPLGWGLFGLPERAAPALLPSTLVTAAAGGKGRGDGGADAADGARAVPPLQPRRLQVRFTHASRALRLAAVPARTRRSGDGGRALAVGGGHLRRPVAAARCGDGHRRRRWLGVALGKRGRCDGARVPARAVAGGGARATRRAERAAAAAAAVGAGLPPEPLERAIAGGGGGDRLERRPLRRPRRCDLARY